MKNIQKYDLCKIDKTLVVFVGFRYDLVHTFEVLSGEHGVGDINNYFPDYKPLHKGKYWGYYSIDFELISKRNGKRPNRKTIDKFIEQVKEHK